MSGAQQQREFYAWCLEHDANPQCFALIEIKRTMQASFGGWTHASYIIRNGKRKRLFQWRAEDNECFERAGIDATRLLRIRDGLWALPINNGQATTTTTTSGNER